MIMSAIWRAQSLSNHLNNLREPRVLTLENLNKRGSVVSQDF